MFGKHLPHERNIKKWYQDIACEPGFIPQSLSLIKNMVEDEKAKGNDTYCHVVFDEFHNRELIQKVGDNVYGFPIIGCPKEGVMGATEVLFFLAVFIHESKSQILFGYLPSTGLLDKEEKAKIVREALDHLQKTGVKVLSITFDGASVNFGTMCELGVDLHQNQDQYFFNHNGMEIATMPDPSHMIKNARNTVAKHILIDRWNRRIDFAHFVKLFDHLQSRDIPTKLTQHHIDYSRFPMKVRLAVQLFSDHVAKEMEKCRVNNVDGFADCEGTIAFVEMFNKIFDVFNSRNISDDG